MLTGLVKRQPFSSENGHQLQEYLLVVRPDTAVCEKIITERQTLFADYGIQAPVDAKPHITVADFLAREEMEATLIRWIQRICSLHTSFRVTLNNYSGLPPHSIYLRVQHPEPFLQLAKQLKAIDDFISMPVSLIGKPHLRIAAKLPERIYDKAMFAYSQKTFHESFVVSELILLKKDDPPANYKTLNVFYFQPVSNLSCGEVA